jgi:hypothetical protein
VKLVQLLALHLFACSGTAATVEAQHPSVTTVTEPGYVNGDGEWRPCDPIAASEKPYVGGPGWRPGCRQSERMGNVAVGFEEPGAWGDDVD